MISLKLFSSVADNNYETGVKALESQYQSAMVRYRKQLQAVTYLEQHTLMNADTITTVAGQQLGNGSINYLEWVMLVSQSIAARNEYIETVNSLNEAIIQLHYLTLNNQ